MIAVISSLPIWLAIASAVACLLRPRDPRFLHILLMAMAFVPSMLAVSFALDIMTAISSARYDQYLQFVDGALGSPSFALGRLLEANPWLMRLAQVDYALIFTWVILIIALTILRCGIREGYRVFVANLISASLAPLFYWLLPASGPRYAFADFPHHAPSIAAPHMVMIAAAPPNCFPSIHTSTALLVLFFVWRWPVVRGLAFVHIALTVVATLGLGEHYSVDLMVAAPYSATVIVITGWVTARRTTGTAEPMQSVEVEVEG